MDRIVFQPHTFRLDEEYVDLFHVYDNLSQTPYQTDRGIQCGDPDQYLMQAWHVITPRTLMRHSDWWNRNRTQFISFYDNLDIAQNEAQRRI